MTAVFRRIERILTRLIAALTSALLAIAACLGLLQVVSRFLLKVPFEWTEVLIRICLNWMVFIGIAIVFRSGSMITVDMARRLMPGRYRRIHETAILVVTLGFLVLLGWWGWVYASRSATQTIIGLDFLSVYWAYISIPIGSVLAIVAAVAHYFDPPPGVDDAEIENTV